MRGPSAVVAAWLGNLLLASTVFAQIGGGLGQGGGGIYLDPEGVLRVNSQKSKAKVTTPKLSEEMARRAELRQVSLRQIAAELSSRAASDGDLPEELALLAGLVKIDYVVVDKANRDVLLVGPAEGWQNGFEGRAVGKSSKRPVLHLEDLVASLRCVIGGPGEVFCSIDPQQSGLAAVQKFLPDMQLPANKKEGEALREQLYGLLDLQTVRTRGVPEGSRFALVMIEADYRMKRMAIGIEKVSGMDSNLEALVQMTESGNHRPNMARWWFTPWYEPFLTNAEGTIFKFQGQGVKLLNEEVYVDRQGNRSGAGQASPDSDKFSQGFTQKFPKLEERYPVYADLHNLFDLMMVAALIQQQNAAEWFSGTALLDDGQYKLPTGPQPAFAEPAVTYQLHGRKEGKQRRNWVTVSFGGVSMRPADFFTPQNIKAAPAGEIAAIPNLIAPTGSGTGTGPGKGAGTGAGDSSGRSKTQVATDDNAAKKEAVGEVTTNSDNRWWANVKTAE